jgi:hypothetical protein
MNELFASIAFAAVGVLIFRSAGWIARLFSDSADRWERDGVIRYGGGLPGNKVWRVENPRKFASRVENARFAAAFTRLLFKAVGAVFVVGGIAQLIAPLFK